MSRHLLLISNSTNHDESYLEHTREYLKKFLGDDLREVLFIPYAAVSFSYVEYYNKVNQVFRDLGYEVRSIEDEPNKRKAVLGANAIVVGGGNTFHLAKKMQEENLVEAIREKVNGGTPYIGWSAGSVVACPTLMTTNDMPVAEPSSFDTLNLVPFQINPHFTDAQIPNFNGETREERLREYLALNPEKVVVGLREGSMLLIDNQRVQLMGPKTIKVFRHQAPTMEYDKNTSLDFLLE